MRKNQLPLLLALFFSAALQAQEARFFPQIGDGFLAAFPTVPRFQTSFVFVNTDDTLQEFSLEFFRFDSAAGVAVPLELTLENPNTQESVTGSSLPISLGPGASISLQTTGTGSLVVGYAQFTVSDDVGGTAVFTGSDVETGIVLFEAGVPATEARNEFSLFVDSLGNQDTGLAIVGAAAGSPAGPAGNSFTLSLFDTAFQQIATTDVPLEPGQHLPQFINQYFQGEVAEMAREMQGSVTVTSAGIPMAAVTLRQLQTNLAFPEIVPTLTTFPVIRGSASSDDSVSAQGRFSVISSGRIRVDVDITQEVESVLLRFYQDGLLVDSALRRPASGQISEYFLVPAGKVTDRVTVELRYLDGATGPELALDR